MKIVNLSRSIALFVLYGFRGNSCVFDNHRHRTHKIATADIVMIYAGGCMGKIWRILVFLLPAMAYSQDNTPPNISYDIPSAFSVGTYINYPIGNSGGSVHQGGYVGRIAGNISVPQGANMTGGIAT